MAGAGINLATAFVSVVPSLRGIRGSLTKGLQSEAAPAGEKAGRTAGKSFGGRLKSLAKTGAVAAGTAAAAGLGYALTRGFQRLSAIDEANAKLRGLGHSSGTVKTIMDGALKSVKGTAFGLDEAATAAAGAVAAGIKPGAELDKTLKSMANSAAAANVPMAEMGSIYNKVASIGKAQNDSLRQVAERGIPIYETLARRLGVTTDEVFKMASAGKIGFKEFEAAMEEASGTVAEEMGKTVPGTLKNLDAAMARLGQGLLAGVFPHIQPLLQSMIGVIDRLTEATGPAAEKIGTLLGGAIQALSGWLDGLRFDSMQGFLDSLIGGFGQLQVKLPAMSGFEPIFRILGGVIRFVANHMHVVVKLLPFLIAGFLAWKAAAAVSNHVMQQQALLLAYSNTLRLISTLIDLRMAQASNAKTRALVTERAAHIKTTIATKLGTAATIKQTIAARAHALALRAQAGAQRLLNLAMKAAPWMLLVAAIAAVAFGLYKFFTATEEGRQLWTQFTTQLRAALAPAMAQFKALQPQLAAVGAQFAQLGGTLMSAFGQALGQIMPVISQLVSTLIAQLIPVVVNLAQTVFPVLVQVIQTIIGVLTPLISAVLPILVTVFTAVIQVVQVVLRVLTPLITLIGTLLVPVIRLLGAVIGFVFKAIGVIISVAVSLITGLLSGLVGFFRAVLAPIFGWLYRNIVVPAFAGIGVYIKAWWIIIKAIFTAVTWFVRTVLAPVFNFLWQAVKIAFQAIRAVIQIWWNTVGKPIFNAIVRFIRGTLVPAFQWLQAKVQQVWAAVRASIASAWATIRANVFNPIVNFIRGRLVPTFQYFQARANQIWSSIRNHLAAVWKSIRSTVFDPMKNAVTQTLPNAFRRGKDAIGKAWDKLKDVAKKPVRFVIDTIINKGVIGGFNKIATKFGADPIDTFKLPKGFRRGGKVWGAGTETSDSIPAMLSRNEHVLSARDVRNLGGHDAVYRLRAEARKKRRQPFLPALAKGGTLIDAANWWVRKGARGSRHPAFGGAVRSGHSRNSLHYQDRAVDLNYGPGGQNATEMRFFDRYVKEFKRLFPGIRVIWRAPGHYNHMHIDTSNGADIGDFSGAASGGGVDISTFLNPFKKLFDKITGGVGNSGFGKMIGKGARKIVEMPIQWITDNAFKVADLVEDTIDNIKEGAHHATVKTVATTYGWGFGRQWDAIKTLVQRESSWNPNAKNPRSSARGLFQKMTSIHGPVERTVLGQARWGLRYIKDTYGTPLDALRFHNKNNWYSQGGPVAPSEYLLKRLPAPHVFDGGGWLTDRMLAVHGKKQPDAVLSSQQWADMHRIALNSDRGAQAPPIIVNIHGVNVDHAEEVAGALRFELNRVARGGKYATV